MLMNKPYLDGYEIDRAKLCVSGIIDRLKAVDMETNKERPYKYYLLEKLQPMLNDIECLISICEGGGQDEKQI